MRLGGCRIILDPRVSKKLLTDTLTLLTRIKQLVRKTICFSKAIETHDIVIGLFVHRYESGLSI
jgi:insertion element IS1 protein InsB